MDNRCNKIAKSDAFNVQCVFASFLPFSLKIWRVFANKSSDIHSSSVSISPFLCRNNFISVLWSDDFSPFFFCCRTFYECSPDLKFSLRCNPFFQSQSQLLFSDVPLLAFTWFYVSMNAHRCDWNKNGLQLNTKFVSIIKRITAR